ncbi:MULTISPECIES: phage holin [Lactococcus]|uniref:phage holin n=1 Tax=Lactococcus TaxID=1357 RepID=UPI000ED8BF54|nr:MULTISPECIES: phage holin [Lactococcus]MBS4464216.1 phage holin [Lactococcus garvieae]HCS85288.1 holin [Lactococcus garvieae]
MIMNDKTYNVIKWIVIIVLPAFSSLVGGLGKAYGWADTDLAVLTINAVTVFFGAVTGASALNYNKQQKED